MLSKEFIMIELLEWKVIYREREGEEKEQLKS